MKILARPGGLFKPAKRVGPANDTIAIGQAVAYLKALEFDAEAITISDDAMLASSEFCGDLCICYVCDAGSALQFVQGKHLASAKMNLETLHEIGLENLNAKISDPSLAISKMGEVYTLLLDEHFDASMMLADKLWDEIMIDHIPDDVVAIVTSRDILVFCDALSAEGIATLKHLLGSLETRSHPLSRDLFLRDKATGIWHLFGGD